MSFPNRNSLGYQGNNSTIIPNIIMSDRAPTANDFRNVNLMDEWFDSSSNEWYKLVSLSAGVADWQLQVSSGTAIDSIVVQTGTSPITADGSGQITFSGGVVAAGTNPVRTNGTAASTVALEVQTSQAIAATDATRIGLSAYNNAHFSVDTNGFVGLLGGGQAIDSFTVPAGTSPVAPSASGVIDWPAGNGWAVTGGLNAMTGNMVSPFTGDFTFTDSQSGGAQTVASVNTSNTAGSTASLQATVGGTSALAALSLYQVSGGSTMAVGMRASDGRFSISPSAIGTGDVFTITQAGVPSFPIAPLPVGSGGLGTSTTPTSGQVPVGNGTNYVPTTLNGALSASIPVNADGTYTLAVTAANNTISGIFYIGWIGTDRVQNISFCCDARLADPTSSLVILNNNSFNAQDVFSNLRIVQQNSDTAQYVLIDVGNRNGSTGDLTITWYGNTNYAPTLAPPAPGANTAVATYGLTVDTAGNYTFNRGSVTLSPAGNKLNVVTGADASAGTSGALTAGTVTVNTTAITASSLVFFTTNTLGTVTVPSAYYVSARTPGVSFTITSNQATDTSTVDWWLIN